MRQALLAILCFSMFSCTSILDGRYPQGEDSVDNSESSAAHESERQRQQVPKAAGPAGAEDLKEMGEFLVKIPEGFSLEQSLKPDFFEYKILRPNNRVILHAFNAAFPTYPLKAPATAQVSEIRVGALVAEDVRWQNEEDSYCRETLIIGTKKPDRLRPPLLHFIYVSNSRVDRDIADSIIDSTCEAEIVSEETSDGK